MVLYVPVLQARAGEFAALDHVPIGQLADLMPLFEVPNSKRDTIDDMYAFFRRTSERLPAQLPIAVDLHGHPDVLPGVRQRNITLLEDLNSWGIPTRPVIHMDDSPRRQADFAEIAMGTGVGAVIRLTSLTKLGAVRATSTRLRALHDHTSLQPHACDLVIDLGLLKSREDIEQQSIRLPAVIAWALHGGWRSVTLAGGSLPAAMWKFPMGRATLLPRLEAMLWNGQRRAGLGFGDYAVQSPATRTRAFAPKPRPNLRYTTDQAWHIYRWSHQTETEEPGMYPLCRAVAATHLSADGSALHSWGDDEILKRAANHASPGRPTDWVAWSTSHHFAQIRRWLDATPAPPTGVPGPRRSLDGQLLERPDS